MKAISINTKLYFLLTEVDGEVHTKEVEMGEKMMWHEALNREHFSEDLKILRQQDSSKIFDECISELKRFSKNDQVNCLAWMCLIANADGFMDKTEWQLIYKIYHKYLDLELNEIMQRQRELNRFIAQYRTQPKPVKTEEQKNKTSSDSKDKLAFPL